MIRGYAEQPSPRAGGTVVLRVATGSPEFRVEFHRWGARLEVAGCSDWLPGREAPFHLPFQDWGEPGTGLHGEHLEAWARYELPVPPDWSPGCYLALLVEGDGRGRPAGVPADRLYETRPGAPCDGLVRPGTLLFVVRRAATTAPRASLYKVPLFTYHAYNLVEAQVYDPHTAEGRWCLYNMPRPEEVPVGFPESVNVHRPGGGAGGSPYDTFNFDPLDPTPRQTFGHWDARMVRWLEREGYQLDYCTDFDLHEQGRSLLESHRALVSAGHDEYWSAEMRSAVEDFTATGGNAAFFAGNVSWWRIRFDSRFSFARVGHWHQVPGREENRMTGTSFRNGGERDRDEHDIPVGFRAQHTDHWVYADTGLGDGDTFGASPEECLVGYECDGAHFDRENHADGAPVHPSGCDGTPPGFTILGVGDTRASGWGMGNAAATMGVLECGGSGGGTVFSAGTTDWPRVLCQGSPVVEQVTRNVLDRLCR